MTTYLLDTNVLIAMAWPVHVHHQATRRWFDRYGAASWATCPITQAGFVRISSHPGVFRDAVRPEIALALLKDMATHPGHQFWPDDLTMADTTFQFPSLLTGHRQITDTYLLSLAARHRGKLATWDRAIQSLDASSRHVCLIG